MEGNTMKDGIIFDMDGTLWDACEVIAESWNVYLGKVQPELEGIVTETLIRNACGLPMDKLGEKVLYSVADPELRMRLTEGCCEYEVEYMQTRCGNLYEGEAEVLAALKKHYHLYIVSNCQVGYIEDYMATSGCAEYFEDFQNFGMNGKQKDENIRILMERNKLDRAVYVGDILGDMRSSEKAGVPFLHAAYGFGEVPEGTPFINSLRELPETVGQFFPEVK